MKALIIGGKGQLGTTLTQTAPEAIEYRSLDLPEIDITDADAIGAVVGDEAPDVIINASAYTAVDRAEEEVDLAYAVNANGPENIALAAKKAGARLVHVSTDYVFDGTACTPYPPEAPCSPLGVYGKSKRQGEINVLDAVEDAVIFRTSWLYSQYGNNFVLTMLRLINERDELKVVADQVGGPTWAATLAAAIWTIVGKTNLKGIYHWSDAGVTSWYDFAVAIQEEALARGMIGKPIPIHPITTAEYPTLTTRPAYSALNCSASWRDLGLDPTQWRVALRRMLDQLKV
ncbi:dTDP-4-dehydrorhamnose reductase [Desulfosarcina sp.]|uniref:dTDP-4-dehydrorhamnose reductase n=1 Tax=Desulfosarcina sp. TaxID=2027861 RepID=UPI0035677C98